jgi:hypothetical protein
MGIGFFDKLKAFGKKIGSGLRKVYDKVVRPAYNVLKPILKPAVQAAATAYGGPGAGVVAGLGMEALDGAMNGKFGEAAAAGKRAVKQMDPQKMPAWLRKAIGD